MESNIVNLAKMVARIAHCNQNYGDQDYEKHLEDVVNVANRFHIVDEEILASVWLHDIIEDCHIKPKIIREYFGNNICDIVMAVTNEFGENRKERNEKTYPKIRKNSKAICVKLLDRIANTEKGILTGNSYKKYKKEYPMFKYMLQEENQYTELWNYLDLLYGDNVVVINNKFV